MSASSSGGCVVDDDAAAIQEGRRLRYVKWPEDNTKKMTLPPKRKELHWPALVYDTHQQAIDLSDNEDFQQSVVQLLMERMEDGEPDPGRCCRMLGFDDGGYLAIPEDVDDDEDASEFLVLSFPRNYGKLDVSAAQRDDYFDMSVEEDSILWECMEAAKNEAKGILKFLSEAKRRQRKRPSDRFRRPPGDEIRKPRSKIARVRKEDSDSESNSGGGGGGGHDNGNDKPGGASSSRVNFASRAATAAATSTTATSSNTTTASGAATTATTREEQAAPAVQETHQRLRMVTIDAARAPVQNNNETVAEEVREQETTAAVAVPVTATPASPIAAKAKPTEEPLTPPFGNKKVPDMSNKSWEEIWMFMRYHGWLRMRCADGRDRFIKPGRSVHDGEEGVDYFTSLDAVQAYIPSRKGMEGWQPPVWNAPPVAAVAAARPVNNNRAMSSSATVITTDSASPAAAKPSKPAARPSGRPERRAAVKGHTQQRMSAFGKGEDRLWWQKYKVPTLSDVKPSLLKLGIRRNESGRYLLPEATGESVGVVNSTEMDIPDSDTLRKFLCSKGVPKVPGEQLLDKQEAEVLHRWVSFAYVPIGDLVTSLRKMNLPPEPKILNLLSKHYFSSCDGTWYPPVLSVAPEDRIDGVHRFTFPEIRDYVRRNVSFQWTEDAFEFSEEGKDPGMPKDATAILRLWGASSPSPLGCYETSLRNIEQMERILPQATNEFESDDEESIADSDMARHDSTDDEAMDSTQGVMSGSETEEDCSSPEDSAIDTSSSDEDDSSQGSTSAVANSSPDSDSAEGSDSSVSDGSSGSSSEGSASSGEESSVQSYVTPPRKSHGKATGKRKLGGGGASRKKAKTLPWWKTGAPPTLAEVKPILNKLGIYQGSDGLFTLPAEKRQTIPSGTNRNSRRNRGSSDEQNKPQGPTQHNEASLCERLCMLGVPVFESSGSKKLMMPLTKAEEETLRRWAYFYSFPGKGQKFVETVKNEALPVFSEEFAGKQREQRLRCAILAAGFSTHADGGGYYPPGIDDMSSGRRDNTVRRRYLLSDMVAVRRYIRSALKLSLDPKKNDSVIESKLGRKKLLALRFWASVDKTLLGTYSAEAIPEDDNVVAIGHAPGTVAVPVPDPEPTPRKPTRMKQQKQQKPLNRAAFPGWWTQEGHTTADIEQQLNLMKQNRIENENAPKHQRRPSRKKPPKWSEEDLALVCEVRRHLHAEVSCSQDGISMDDMIKEISGVSKWGLPDIRAFLQIKEGLISHKAINGVRQGLRKWLVDQRSPMKKASATVSCTRESAVEELEDAIGSAPVAEEALMLEGASGDEQRDPPVIDNVVEQEDHEPAILGALSMEEASEDGRSGCSVSGREVEKDTRTSQGAIAVLASDKTGSEADTELSKDVDVNDDDSAAAQILLEIPKGKGRGDEKMGSEGRNEADPNNGGEPAAAEKATEVVDSDRLEPTKDDVATEQCSNSNSRNGGGGSELLGQAMEGSEELQSSTTASVNDTSKGEATAREIASKGRTTYETHMDGPKDTSTQFENATADDNPGSAVATANERLGGKDDGTDAVSEAKEVSPRRMKLLELEKQGLTGFTKATQPASPGEGSSKEIAVSTPPGPRRREEAENRGLGEFVTSVEKAESFIINELGGVENEVMGDDHSAFGAASTPDPISEPVHSDDESVADGDEEEGQQLMLLLTQADEDTQSSGCRLF